MLIDDRHWRRSSGRNRSRGRPTRLSATCLCTTGSARVSKMFV